MLSLEQVLMGDNRQEVPFPPPCPTEAAEGAKWDAGWDGGWAELLLDGFSRPWTLH